MTFAVFKYKLLLVPDVEQVVYLPGGAEILTVELQRDFARLWAKVMPELRETQPRHIVLAWTGHDLPDAPLRHINTFMSHNGDLVWHAFEKLPA
jgi:hypothetical protein